jgi:hypothetical protein
MKKHTQYRTGLTAATFGVPVFLAVVLSATVSPVFGVLAVAAAVGFASGEKSKVRANSDEANAESDRLASTWDANRPTDERSVRVQFDLPTGGSVVNTYRKDDEQA